MKIAAKNTEISDSGRPRNAQGWEALGENEHFVVCEVRRGRQSWRVWRASQFVYAYLGKLHGIKYQFNHWFSLHSLALRPDVLTACKRGSFFGIYFQNEKTVWLLAAREMKRIFSDIRRGSQKTFWHFWKTQVEKINKLFCKQLLQLLFL